VFEQPTKVVKAPCTFIYNHPVGNIQVDIVSICFDKLYFYNQIVTTLPFMYKKEGIMTDAFFL